MDLRFTDEELAFRDEARAFIKANLPAGIRERKASTYFDVTPAQIREWHRILFDKGWAAPAWPKEYGGTGWSSIQRYIWEEVSAEEGAPPLSPFGITMVGPVIYTFGTEEQKARHLPGILSGEVAWCQGYSEPGSGSDLASLKTRAEDKGDHFLVNGQKIWTTHAHLADWIFALVRTDPDAKKQEGISFLLIDMKTPGVEVRPIITIDKRHELNEVFFDDVRVPKENLVGKLNKGWTYAKFLLGNERTGIAEVGATKQRLRRLRDMAATTAAGDGTRLADVPEFSQRLAAIEIDLTALEYTNLRILADEASGKGVGAEASMLKIRGSELQQAVTELAVEALGLYAGPYAMGTEGSNLPPVGPDEAEPAVATYLFLRAATIYGGSNEIQRDVISKAVLGL